MKYLILAAALAASFTAAAQLGTSGTPGMEPKPMCELYATRRC